MRRALLDQLPLLTEFYGLGPGEFYAMSGFEINAYVTHMAKALEARQAEG